MTSNSTRRGFLARTLLAGAGLVLRRLGSMGRWLRAAPAAVGARALGTSGLTHGPILGHLQPTGVRVWARCEDPGSYALAVAGPRGEIVTTADATRERDHTMVFEVSGLEPGQPYRYEVRQGGRTIFAGEDARFLTPLPQTAPAVIRLAVGSCAREEEGDRAVWRRMASLEPQALVLLGDTPYIDSTDLAVQRRRYGEFWA